MPAVGRVSALSNRSEDLLGGAAAGGDRAIHVATPHLGRLRSGPVDTADRRSQRLALLSQCAGTETATVATSCEFLCSPVLFDDVERLSGLRPEILHQRIDHELVALLGRQLRRLAGVGGGIATTTWPALMLPVWPASAPPTGRPSRRVRRCLETRGQSISAVRSRGRGLGWRTNQRLAQPAGCSSNRRGCWPSTAPTNGGWML